MKVEVLQAWPRRYLRVQLDLPEGARVSDALRAAGLGEGAAPTACAVFGEAVEAGRVLVEGDRLEVLRPLLADPKDARRRRARLQRGKP